MGHLRRCTYSPALICLLLLAPVFMQAQVVATADTASIRKHYNLHLFSPKFINNKAQQILHVGLPLVVAGAFTYNHGEGFKDMRDSYIPNFRYRYDDYLQYAPAAILVGMKSFGVKGRSSWGRMLVSDAFSAGLMALTVNTIKSTVSRKRPDGSAYNSFPSGHTATAFMTATMLHKEYGLTRSPLYSIAGYGIATATALSRQMNNRHWISDVLTGAGIGIISTELGYYLADLIFKEKGLQRPVLTPNEEVAYNGSPSFIALRTGYGMVNKTLSFAQDMEIRMGGGSSVAIEGAYFFNRNVGVGGKMNLFQPNIHYNKDKLLSKLPEKERRGTTFNLKPGNTTSVNAGVYYSYPLPYGLFLGSSLTGGVNWSESYKIDLTNENKETRELLSFQPSVAPNMEVGISATKMMSENFGVKFYADYNLSRASFPYTYPIQDSTGHPVASASKQQHITIHAFLIGMSINAYFW